MKSYFLVLITILSGYFFAKAQELADLVNDPDYIKTVTFNKPPQNMLPIYNLGDRIVMSFDDVIGDEANYYYQIEHYDYDWTSSALFKNEFLEGVDDRRILNYRNSFTTLQSYSHYEIAIPNQFTTGLTVSGNYMIHIYNNDRELVFSRKFMLLDNQATVGVAVKRARDLKFVQTQQRVEFNIDSQNINFINPNANLKVAIFQNSDLNSGIYGIKPQFNIGNNQVYKYDGPTSFWAGNEYLNFENRDFRAPNVNIDYVRLDELYNSYLFVDQSRAFREYTYNPDINGNFLVTTTTNEDNAVQAEYLNVHFKLDPVVDLPKNSSVFITGNYNGFQYQDENLMRFNPVTKLYEATILLKQGFYNYRYTLIDANGIEIPGAITGNNWQTENAYTILAYYREPGGRYDRLIGIGEGNSAKITN
ncbi:type IX secretion system plug protein [Nonlabens marinus]|uniref:Type 9 secretion system plug protein N-terminal domain-containing protein n=1 Tax=Nonlabens marinus S1-08 TaxID=1454201 RepID=W8VZX3_9FLAO|nr:DUF5103 domain-containing protein [Nonlabens marinus]BAO55326.1 hypothetical protein NMS_1317 [Nonlabens marinus S1-08]